MLAAGEGGAAGAVAPDLAAADAAGATDAPLFRLPARAILPLCFMPLGLMMVEGAFIDWSAVFAREVLAASPLAVGVVYAAFSLVMAAVRLSGDALAERFGDVVVVRASAVAATAGIAGFALAPNVAAAPSRSPRSRARAWRSSTRWRSPRWRRAPDGRPPTTSRR